MNLKKHIIEQPFIFATGLAALIHSTWSLGTIFAGKQPDATNILELVGWLLPALLIAFALDIGQIVTSAEIRAGQRTRAKYATFIIFAIATYYLQWLYIAHHMPQLELSGGVRAEWSYNITILRDLAVWIVPALLPLSTALYTLSQQDEIEAPQIAVTPSIEVLPFNIRWQQDEKLLPDSIEDKHEEETQPYYPDSNNDIYAHLNPDLQETESAQEPIVAVCHDCGWESEPLTSQKSIPYSLRAHRNYCTALHAEVE